MKEEQEIKEIEKLFDRLFPINRSITGSGLRKSLAILNEYLPLERFSVKTGTKVLNWTIPEEWRIKEAWLRGPDGEKILDFKDHNLHLLNYSTAIDKNLELEELKEHLHTIASLPDAIPYVTSYYKKRWGFCLPYNKYKDLKEGQYHAYIDSELVEGELNYGHAILPGESDQEILISTYICHPSMANNELSGPLVATFLYNRLRKWKNRRFTYRFVFVPETIGAIAYLAKFGKELVERVYSGMVLTCIGGETNLNYKLSRDENNPIDNIVKHLFTNNDPEGSIRPFTPIYGSDERHYCSPGFNLPVGQMARLVYGYPEYHTSADNRDLISIESLYESVNEVEKVLRALELDGYYLNQFPYGEIKLDQHGLYPDINTRGIDNHFEGKLVRNRNQVNQILTILNYSDAKYSLREIAEKFNQLTRCNISLLELEEMVEILKEKGLLKGPYSKEEAKKI
ncbi:DUF4910 domain-containing protein [Orenia marismortui]|uniref:Aminopeptidase-like protein n=1 Tax=Orenia marismortui TaxID=46469 RepID=A0A4R8HFL8_9FIRM|nr:DUF4910 domain-containing protein [Orenia marismortui]TDX58936.1 aminopeptidase-like protein [Orenia marismortui]